MEPVVLVGVDGSQGSRAALAWAADEARRRGWHLVAVMAWRSMEAIDDLSTNAGIEEALENDAHRLLDEVIEEADLGDLAVERVVEYGDPSTVLCRRSAEAGMLVLGARGNGALARLLLGSVSRRCVHHSACPVVIVRETAAQSSDAEQADVVVGVDGSENSRNALAWAAEEARLYGWTMEILWVWNDSYEGSMAFELQAPRYRVDHAKALAEIEDRLANEVREVLGEEPAIPVSARVVGGEPSAVLCDHSDAARLLVLGARGRGGIVGALLGSVAGACAHHSHCTVAIVPPVASTDAP
jgi:nucleotide-binding universal stress UspA family protein